MGPLIGRPRPPSNFFFKLCSMATLPPAEPAMLPLPPKLPPPQPLRVTLPLTARVCVLKLLRKLLWQRLCRDRCLRGQGRAAVPQRLTQARLRGGGSRACAQSHVLRLENNPSAVSSAHKFKAM